MNIYHIIFTSILYVLREGTGVGWERGRGKARARESEQDRLRRLFLAEKAKARGEEVGEKTVKWGYTTGARELTKALFPASPKEGQTVASLPGRSVSVIICTCASSKLTPDLPLGLLVSSMTPIKLPAFISVCECVCVRECECECECVCACMCRTNVPYK